MKFLEKLKSPKYILIFILVLYSIISFYKIGSIKNPQTFINLRNNEQLIYQLDENKIPAYIKIFNGYNETYISVFFTNDLENTESYQYDKSFQIQYNNVLNWETENINYNSNKYKYIILQSYFDTTTIGEIKIYDINDTEIKIIATGEKEERLLDEQNTVPDKYSYMNSAYFDEIYFPRTAYEHLNNLPIYTYNHPPLGMLLMSIPIYLFGLTPFAYRLGGNICGILMILIIYLIVKELLEKEKYALFAAAIMALDGMHFVQTRIGTVDSYLVLFCITSFLFFIKYIKIPSEKPLKAKKISLLISGIFFGMALSVKWTALYTGFGMAIIYFVKFFKGKKLDIKLLGWSSLSFVIIPIIIYVCFFIPTITNPNSELTFSYTYKNKTEEAKYFAKSTIESKETHEDGSLTVYYKVKIKDLKTFIEYQKIIYLYHSRLEDQHPYSSKWYTWPIMQRPIWYYISRSDNSKIGTIACMGNPGIWYLGIITTIFTLIYSIIKKNKEGLIIITMISTTWLTYYFIGRSMFLYHFFICLPYMMMTIPFTISILSKIKKQFDIMIPILTIIFLGFFIYFYPVYSGKQVTKQRIVNTEWLDTWEYDGLIKEEREKIKSKS